jgi:hypothetical protein
MLKNLIIRLLLAFIQIGILMWDSNHANPTMSPWLIGLSWVMFISIWPIGQESLKLSRYWLIGSTVVMLMLISVINMSYDGSVTSYLFSIGEHSVIQYMVLFFVLYGLFFVGLEQKRWFADHTSYMKKYATLFARLLASSFLSLIGYLFTLLLLSISQLPYHTFPLEIVCFPLFVAISLTILEYQPKWVEYVKQITSHLLLWMMPFILLGNLVIVFDLFVVGQVSTAAVTSPPARFLLICLFFGIVVGFTTFYPTYQKRRWGRVASYLTLIIFILSMISHLKHNYLLFVQEGSYYLSSESLFWWVCLTLLSLSAVGYLLSLIFCRQTLKWLACTHIYGLWSLVLILFLTSTPLADLDKMSINYRVAKLENGAVSAANFNYDALMYGQKRYGKDALIYLRDRYQGSNAEQVKEHAQDALSSSNKSNYPFKISLPETNQEEMK